MNIKSFLDQHQIRYTAVGEYQQALTHTSYVNENKSKANDYERLEFMGDAVLQILTSEFIYLNCKDMQEGEMTMLRAKAVREESLASYARELDLGQYIALGKGEEKSGGRDRDSVLANVFEALLGAIYLDTGLSEARKILELVVFPRILNKQFEHLRDYKTTLQELIQTDRRENVHYELVSKSGPSNAPTFEIVVKMGLLVLGIGKGNSKKTAEQEAAKAALSKMVNGE